MKLKAGASLQGVKWQLFHASIKVEAVLKRWNAECMITSGTDGKHGLHNATLHPEGLALDYRNRDLRKEDWQLVARDLRVELGPDYDVVVEVDHFHVEFQPKGIKV